MNTTKRYTEEVRDRAVRMVLEHERERLKDTACLTPNSTHAILLKTSPLGPLPWSIRCGLSLSSSSFSFLLQWPLSFRQTIPDRARVALSSNCKVSHV